MQATQMADLKANKALKWLSLSGVLAFVAVFCEDLIGSMNYPGYNWMGRAFSDLTALDSPSRVIAAGFSGASAMLGALFGGVVVVYFSSRANRSFRIGTYLSLIGGLVSSILFGFFPLTEAWGISSTLLDIMHISVVVPLIILFEFSFLVLYALGGLRKGGPKSIGIAACVTIGLTITSAVALSFVPLSIYGIVERISIYSGNLLTVFISLYIFLERGDRLVR